LKTHPAVEMPWNTSELSAVVVHATTDDNVTDPAGNSGDRIACGVITKGAARGM